MNRCLLLLFYGLVFNSGTLCSQSYTSTPQSVRINGNCGGYYEFLPTNYNEIANSTDRYPLLIDIAGSGGQGSGTIADLSRIVLYNTPYYLYNNVFPNVFFSEGKPFSFLVMAPQFLRRGSGADIKDVIDFFVSRYRVDTTRIYITGFSNGGEPTWAYPCMDIKTASKIAALVPVAGVNTNVGHVGADNIANAKLPVWALHSSDDAAVPLSSSANFVKAINKYNPVIEAILTELTGTHNQTGSKVYNPETKFSINNKEVSIYEWMLGYKREAVILPLKLLSLNGRLLENESVQLDWLTEEEYHNNYFKLEKSQDTFSFVELARIESNKNSPNNSYRYIDDNPYEGMNYYRLSQTDLNGKQTFFPVISVNRGDIKPVIKVYPTLINSEPLKIIFTDPKKRKKTIQIIDISGKVLYKSTGNFQNETIISSYILNVGLNIIDVSCPEEPLLNKRVRVIRYK